MECSTPGLPVRHQLTELTQTRVHWVGDAAQRSHPLPSLLLLPSIFPSIRIFSNESLPHIRWPNVGVWALTLVLPVIFRTDFLYEGLVGYPCSPRDSQESSPTPQSKSINSLVLSFLYSPTFTSIHDYWKNQWTDFVGKVMSLLFNMLSGFVIAFLPRSKCLLISWLWSPSTVILEPK